MSSEPGGTQLAGLKSLLLRAWRERWTDMQWSINVKKCLKSTDHDNYQLAELLLQQALVGSSPNGLVLSYLRHAMSSQMISYTAAIQSILQFEDVSKPYCIKSLLDVICGFSGRVSTRGTSEDSLALSKSLLSLQKWVLELMVKCLHKLIDNKMATEYVTLLERLCDITTTLNNNSSTRALLHVAHLDNKDIMTEMKQTGGNICSLMKHNRDVITTALHDNITTCVDTCYKIENLQPDLRPLLDISQQPLNLTLNALLAQEAVLNPTSDIQAFAEQIIVVEKTQGLKRPELYCELLRTCLLGLIDAVGGQDEIKWAAFAFLKLPQVLVKMVQGSSDKDKQLDLDRGLERLLTYVHLMDLADTKCNCDCLSFLLHELKSKFSLVSDQTYTKLMHRRQAESKKPKLSEQAGAQHSASLILRAEPTVQSILKNPTLDADYSKNQEALLGVLCHMLSGKSFELILAAAAATGRLQSFAIKLIKFNEFAKQTMGEAGKASQTRALLFDITFLMLCHIMQLYGTEIVSTTQDASNSFFAQWVMRCLPEDGKYKSVELLAPPDHNKVEVLLGQFNPGGELKTNLTRWHDVCHNAPYAVQEVLYAWEHGAINSDTVKNICDNVKGRMCCLPVIVVSWLCSYINTIDEDIRKKPLNIIQQMIKPLTADPSNQYYTERSHLMQIILSGMYHGVLPPHMQRPSPYNIPRTQPAYTMLMETFRGVLTRGCVDIKAIHKLENLLTVGGAKWFCEHIIKEVMSRQHDRHEDLYKGISLVYALFHIDLENLTMCLLYHTLPGLLNLTGARLHTLTDPRGRALAKLTIMCLTVIHRMRQMQKESPTVRKGRKRTRTDIELEDQDDGNDESRPSKMRKLPGPEEAITLTSDPFSIGDLIETKEDLEPIPTYDPKNPLNRAMVSLMRVFTGILCQSQVSQKHGFIMSFVEEAVQTGPDTARFILQFMPLPMVSQLMKCLPSQFTPELLLMICDLSSVQGRKVATKVISQNAKYQKMIEGTGGLTYTQPQSLTPNL